SSSNARAVAAQVGIGLMPHGLTSLGTHPSQSQRQLSMLTAVSQCVSPMSNTAHVSCNVSFGAADALTVNHPVEPSSSKPVPSSSGSLALNCCCGFASLTPRARTVHGSSFTKHRLPVYVSELDHTTKMSLN